MFKVMQSETYERKVFPPLRMLDLLVIVEKYNLRQCEEEQGFFSPDCGRVHFSQA